MSRILGLSCTLLAGLLVVGCGQPAEEISAPPTSQPALTQTAEQVTTTTIAPATSAPTTTVTAPAPTTTAGPQVVELMGGTIPIKLTYPANPTPEDKEVLDAYAKYLQVFLASGNPANPDYPGLAEVLHPDSLQRVRDGRRLLQQAGSHNFGEYVGSPRVVGRDGDAVVVDDCALDATGIVDRNGAVVQPAELAPFLIRSTVVRTAGVLQVRSLWIAERTCAG